VTKKGDRCRISSSKWYGQYRDENKTTQRVPLSANKTAAQQMLNDLMRRVG